MINPMDVFAMIYMKDVFGFLTPEAEFALRFILRNKD